MSHDVLFFAVTLKARTVSIHTHTHTTSDENRIQKASKSQVVHIWPIADAADLNYKHMSATR